VDPIIRDLIGTGKAILAGWPEFSDQERQKRQFGRIAKEV
jgi:hypothetical protein